MYNFIWNPVSGKAQAAITLPIIERIMTEHGKPFRFLRTEAPGHAAELVKNALNDGAEALIAVGGDGLLQEIAGEMVGLNAGKHVPLG
ncbi:MAG: acylglycerol kinase family protein, partial [Clostridiales bacterium]|nr:acylglycerol kinase family protein [Clostridiales bacterium]